MSGGKDLRYQRKREDRRLVIKSVVITVVSFAVLALCVCIVL